MLLPGKDRGGDTRQPAHQWPGSANNKDFHSKRHFTYIDECIFKTHLKHPRKSRLARRTKEDARATRESLIDAAELLFQEQGVSSTSLSDIARQAGTTRGAIYWHFTDKADLFNAMMDRVTLPLEQAFLDHESDPEGSPLDHMRRVMRDALKQISNDERTRRVFEVATQKVEYVDELQAVRARHLKIRNDFLAHMERLLRLAADQQRLTIALPLHMAVHGLHAMVDGLIQNWLLDREAFDLTATGGPAIDVYLAGLGLKL